MAFGLNRIVIFISNIARPIRRVNTDRMRPSNECMIAKAGYFVSVLSIVRESEVFTPVYDDLKALVVDNRPESNISVVVCG